MFSRFQPWQRKKLLVDFLLIVLLGLSFLTYASVTLIRDKSYGEQNWQQILVPSPQKQASLAAISQNATVVTAGTYVENLKAISLKDSNFHLDFLVWFLWTGDQSLDMAHNFRIYNGDLTHTQIVKQSHMGDEHYQLVRCSATISNHYWTIRFPLESHQLRFYIEPNYTADRVVLQPDKENSGQNPALSITGYKLMRNEVGLYIMEYDNAHADPTLDRPAVNTELATAMEINRNSLGLYIKCYIALAGTILWVMIMLFINIYHQLDPLNMIAPVLFGSITNIMVGANLLPDALSFGLLEYINIWGVLTIITVALSIININRIRSKHQDREFAMLYGKIMFFTILGLTLLENVLLPVCAYQF